MKASLKIPIQDFKANHMGYLEILIAYQQHIINLQWKHEYALGEFGTADENPLFSYGNQPQLTHKTPNWY